MDPSECEECATLEKADASLDVVAEHWIESHQAYLEVLRAALTIYQAQEAGLGPRAGLAPRGG
jgi:hypothetical protein